MLGVGVGGLPTMWQQFPDLAVFLCGQPGQDIFNIDSKRPACTVS